MPRNATTPVTQPIFREPTFNEVVPTLDPKLFSQAHPSDTQLYQQIADLLKKDVVFFPTARGKPGDLYALQDALGPQGPDMVKAILTSKQITFHAAGDTGASNVGKYGRELNVADQVTMDTHISGAGNKPAFLFHLGDVVYDFGESVYYYDQFYEPYRNYPAPIFAVPGNHDSFIVPNTPPNQTPLTTFARNFCSPKPAITAEAKSLHRTAMTQPGVYFALDAPFVRIIGLFSNALEDPGLISSEKGKWKGVPDVQLDFLTAQLRQIKDKAYPGAVLIACHHPPFSYSPPAKVGGSGGNHGCSSDMLAEIDSICVQEGVYPHAFLSGHAHNYQRYTRTVAFDGKDCDVPFIVCGDGGHNVNPLVQASKGKPAQEPINGSKVDYLEAKKTAVTSKGLLLERYDDQNYGYLRIAVDKSQLRIGFHTVGAVSNLAQSRIDMVTVDLASHTMVAN